MGRRSLFLAFAAVFAFSATAWAQTQIKPRVLIMVDTSGSMTLHLDSNVLDSGGDGSFYYEDGVLTRGNINGPAVQYSLNPGFSTGGFCTANPTFDTNSRMLAAKQAVTSVINASGDIDWGLMRYSGDYCAIDNTVITDPATRPRMQPMAWPNANYQAGSAGANDARRQPGFSCTVGGNDCAAGAVCDPVIHKCRCTGPSQCPFNTTCDVQTGVCECSATNSTECPNSLTCDVSSGYCKCTTGAHCTSGTCGDADVGQCTCNANGDCPSGSCDTATGMCNCTSEGDCSSELCVGGVCVCANANLDPTVEKCLSDVCDVNTGICGCSAGNQCPSGTCTSGRCRCSSGAHCLSGTCTGGFCTCTNDHQCMANEFCVSGVCTLDVNMCELFMHGSTSTRNDSSCQSQYDLPGTFSGTCGTGAAANTPPCNTKQTCYADADCSGGTCDLTASGTTQKWGYCTCNGAGQCPASGNWTCTGSNCVYNRGCRSAGGVVIVNPATGGTSDEILLWVDGREIYKAGGNANTDNKINPELRSRGDTPLASAARAATDWYNTTSDSKKICRPYVLVQLTDGFDTCEDDSSGSTTDGPVAAAHGFVSATVQNAKVPNKVYVVGLAFGGASTTTLDNIAKAGGTVKARLANTQQDIEAALADIVASSILVEKCNHADDDCNDKCDEPFPGVALPAGCGGPKGDGSRDAGACDNGLLGHCNAPGIFVCSADKLSQVCQTRQCTSGTADLGKAGSTITLAVAAPTFTSDDNGKIVTITSAGANKGNFPLTFVDSTHVSYTNAGGATQNGVSWNLYCVNSEDNFGCNGFDDNCDGLKDNCSSNPQQEGSCCISLCPACAPVGGGPETCNNCDDDCDGVIDNHLIDVPVPCGSNIGICVAGNFQCCSTPSGNCLAPTAGGTNTRRCVGAFPDPSQPESCNGVDDNCDGQTDEGLTQACFAPNTPGAANFPAPAMPGNGPCLNGTRACAATTCGPPPASCCPGGWPAGRDCPVPAMYSNVCVGAIGPGLEVCDNIDNDCDGTIDDNVTDSWAGMTCCSTGNINDCPNMNGCHPGMYICSMGVKTCGGSQAKGTEVCNGLDDDCNGVPDDNIPQNGGPCGNNVGRCRAHYVCNGSNGGGPNGLTCMIDQGVMPEICDGLDNDCDGKTDELTDTGDTHDLMRDDSRVGAACDVPIATANLPPCMAGTNKCVDGSLVCGGSVKPQPNECGKAATDCTGNPASVCPEGAVCYMGQCVTECANTEFPCPGGFRCDRTQDPNLCLPDACTKANCATDEICKINLDGSASCVDPCIGVPCPTGFRCRGGACIDDSCRTFGCAAGQVCLGTPPTCQVDPCATANCGVDQFCQDGDCKDLCATLCLTGQACIDGVCVDDPCADKTCRADQVCKPMGGVPTCIENTCLNTDCGTDRVCCGGACTDDPCLGLNCPAPTTCVRTSTCAATCTAIGTQNPEERIVGAGGGGAACSMGGRGANGSGFALFGFFVFFAFFLRRRRGSGEVR